MNEDTLRQLVHDRLHERMREAQSERLALQLRDPRYRRTGRRWDTSMLGQLRAARRRADALR